MRDVAIQVEGLGKRYRIGELQKYKALRDVLTNAMYAPFRTIISVFSGQRAAVGDQLSDNYIWALKDVSFKIKHGEVVGIIGRNGAGKSTLLKILSRITEPTEGEARVYGRVGSLLEVGTGFHPELTGRENLYLNGAILGMRKVEIDRKFDEIVAFAEVEQFIDTPVKLYSSGMYVRLAFAVAAHLETEILLVDEVLAVGDAQFQKKCLGKMGDVAKGGRTVFFVSHQMNSIRKLCERCMWIDTGQMRMMDSTTKVVSAYEAALVKPLGGIQRDNGAAASTRFLGWEIVEPQTGESNVINTLETITFKMTVQVVKAIQNGVHGIALWNSDGQLMWAWAAYNLKLETGIHNFIYALPTLPLRPGVYYWHVSLYDGGNLLDNWHCVPPLVIATDPLTHPRDEWSGVLNIPCDFRCEEAKSFDGN
jgi:ABC-type polysaccharide/polyol phosphate transport system ATPase subunit